MGTETKAPVTVPIRIPTTLNRSGDGLESGDLVVTEVRWGKCSIGVVPEGREARREQDGPMIPGPWAYTVTHAAVIDNTGQAKREYDAATKIPAGALVTVDGLPGTYTLEARDPGKLEGDGVKLVPADSFAKANEARCKAQGELGWIAKKVGVAEVKSVAWRQQRAVNAILELEEASGVHELRLRLDELRAAALANGKEVA